MTSAKDVSAAQFPQAVLARSKQVPVVVDFWAEWCAPCRALGPTLEREVAALGGRVELAKVDVDGAQALAQQYGVQGIPAVMAFLDGQVVAQFVGAKDARFVRQWLEQLAPSEAALALEQAGDEPTLRALVAHPDVGPAARVKLGEWLLGQARAAEAVAVLGEVPPGSKEAAQAQQLVASAAFRVDLEAFGGEALAQARVAADGADLEACWALACAHVVAGRTVEALDAFLSLLQRSRKFRDDGARKAMVTLFEQLGPQHALTREYRRRLQAVL